MMHIWNLVLNEFLSSKCLPIFKLTIIYSNVATYIYFKFKLAFNI